VRGGEGWGRGERERRGVGWKKEEAGGVWRGGEETGWV